MQTSVVIKFRGTTKNNFVFCVSNSLILVITDVKMRLKLNLVLASP